MNLNINTTTVELAMQQFLSLAAGYADIAERHIERLAERINFAASIEKYRADVLFDFGESDEEIAAILTSAENIELRLLRGMLVLHPEPEYTATSEYIKELLRNVRAEQLKFSEMAAECRKLLDRDVEMD